MCAQLQLHCQKRILDCAYICSFVQLQPAVTRAAGVVRLAQVHTDACELRTFFVLRMHVCIYITISAQVVRWFLKHFFIQMIVS